MLGLLHTYGCAPTSDVHHLILPKEILLVYPSADSVVILDASTLSLTRILPFWEVFPGTRNSKLSVKCVSVDAGMKLIVASMSALIAVWSLSGVEEDKWRLHSSLQMQDLQEVTTMDCRSGLLTVGSRTALSVYTLILENDLPTWSKKWTISTSTPSQVRFSPSLMYIASTSSQDNNVRICSTTSGRQVQSIRHPRPVTKFTWRVSPKTSSRDDLILYTITTDATLRIFLPVLDAPQHLQLHASLDLSSCLSSKPAPKSTSMMSGVFWLDRQVVGDALLHTLVTKSVSTEEGAPYRRIRELKDEGWDLFLRVLGDGSLVIKAVANIDSRPPTLLKQFTLLQSLPSTLPSLPAHVHLLPRPEGHLKTPVYPSTSSPAPLILLTSPPLTTYALSPLPFFDAQPSGLDMYAATPDVGEGDLSTCSKVVRFVRTSDGEGVAVIRDGAVEVWTVSDSGRRIRRISTWGATDHVVVLESGHNILTHSDVTSSVTLHCKPPATLAIPSVSSLFSLPPTDTYTSIIGITPSHSIFHIRISHPHTSAPSLTLVTQSSLPLPSPPKLILPVDPMAWSTSFNRNRGTTVQHDVLLSVSDEGELAFWVLDDVSAWRCTGRVETWRRGFKMARCSSAKKSVLVVPTSTGDELTIWDSKESEFASGLEYRTVYSVSEPVKDLDWTSTPDLQSILAVGFTHHVELLCQQRMTYFDEGPGWGVCWKIELGHMIPHSISDSIWLAGGSLLVGAGHQLCLFGRLGTAKDSDDEESLFEHVARHNGPLEDYHPQMLLQCLLWEKVDVVKEIIVNLAEDLGKARKEGKRKIREWQSIPVEHYFRNERLSTLTRGKHKPQYSFLFDASRPEEGSDEEGFSRSLVQTLIEELETSPLTHLTPNENAHLVVLVQTTLEVDEQRRALDANGLRYLISMRSFYILNQKASTPNGPESQASTRMQTGRRERLRYRDMVWAFHSQSQDILLSASTAACDGKMTWSDARALGLFLWLNSAESMRAQMEVIARNHYMAGDNRDPEACSLFYFALGKVKLVHGLWRSAVWHREQTLMLKFLSHDFSESRWRTSALKNAYALLGKRRFQYAAAFFLLGGSLKDAVSVCLKQLSDVQLAVALARVVEHGDEGPVLQGLLNNYVIPLALKNGNRWLGSWAFWLLRRRDMAVRILITPLGDIASALVPKVAEIGNPHYDDPSLALLFSQIKSKTLQTVKGTSEISGRTEYNFVLQIARVFCRMGCHVLALDLLRSWSFDRPSTERLQDNMPSLKSSSRPTSPTSRRSTFGFSGTRRMSILIDMDVASGPPTRAHSPQGQRLKDVSEAEDNDEGDLSARKASLGSLMKSAKQDVKVPEFDMGAFGF